MMNIKRFHPGVYLKDELEVLNMTASEFSVRTGISERTLSGLFNQKGSITFDIAYKLSNYFGNSISFWTNLQNSYDLYLRQEQEQNEIEEDWDLIKSNSLKNYLIDLKIIGSLPYSQKARDCTNLAFLFSIPFINFKIPSTPIVSST